MSRITLFEAWVGACMVAILALVGWAAWAKSSLPQCVEYGPRRLVLIPQKIGSVTTMQQVWRRDCLKREGKP